MDNIQVRQQTYMDIAKKWLEFFEHPTDFDQAIIETTNSKDLWIHVSCRKNIKKNRHQVLRLTKK